MAGKSKCFTFIWNIKNFIFSSNCIGSPDFYIHEMQDTKWRLFVQPYTNDFEDFVTCYVQMVTGHGQAWFKLEIDCELSFLDADGSVLHSETFLKKVYRDGSTECTTTFHIKRKGETLRQKDLYFLDGTLTIRCRIWNKQQSISILGKCQAETQIEQAYINVVGIFTTFGSIESSEKYPIFIKSPSAKVFISSMDLCVSPDGMLDIEIIPFCPFHSEVYYKFKIFIMDRFEKKVTLGQGELQGIKSHLVPLNFSKEYLMKNRTYFLHKGELTIHCEMTVYRDMWLGPLKCNHTVEYALRFEETDTITPNARRPDVFSEKYHTENLTTLKEDWISLYKENVLWDTKLKTATETFPAHTVVLSARSPVFKSMFTTDMREKTSNCVEIDDLDADTVRRLLLFMYSDTLDDLEYHNAKSLYFAADKYNIVSLRRRCASFLRNNLLLSNCCDILLLADRHQDESLKSAVQDYIAKNDKAVLFSDEWKNLEKNHSLLTIEVFRFIYMKNRTN